MTQDKISRYGILVLCALVSNCQKCHDKWIEVFNREY